MFPCGSLLSHCRQHCPTVSLWEVLSRSPAGVMASPPGAHPYSTVFILKGLVFGGLTFLNWSEGFPDSSAAIHLQCRRALYPGLIPGWGRSAGEGVGYPFQYSWASLVAQLVKNPPAMRETWVRSLGWEDPLEKGKATHYSILAWRIQWTVVHGAAKSWT